MSKMEIMKDNISKTSDLIFNTPLVRINKIVEKGHAEILAKLECANPSGSVKDRICMAMIEAAEKNGQLKKGYTIIEATSGNTGISLAFISAIKGYKLLLTMPDNCTIERKTLLNLYGADIEFTPSIEGMPGAIRKAEQLAEKYKNCYMPQQFNNIANPAIHRKTTAEEIWQATKGELDAFVSGVGTGGTITGVGEVFKERKKDIQIVAVEPKDSAVLSGRLPGPHNITGIGSGFIPKILNVEIIDRIIPVTDKDAFKTSIRLAREEGLLVGISSGAVAFAALHIAKELGKGKRVVTIFPDNGERYLNLYQPYFP
ncbi:MAG: cysteine synthase [Candidatus Scalindua rubra]|uniref:cysteine synthase n=1 Tax=Candidatus Scalindua rubra TaxID=1872076 RepID=A0A1E3X4Z9_9BACT|nr:MAG: cysteine synthase [Candidatus Scalindua rubra]